MLSLWQLKRTVLPHRKFAIEIEITIRYHLNVLRVIIITSTKSALELPGSISQAHSIIPLLICSVFAQPNNCAQ